MTKTRIIAFVATIAFAANLLAVTKGQLQERFQQLPSVAEKDLPKFSNRTTPFRGSFTNSSLRGYTYVTFPFVENPGSFCFDDQGRLYVAEAHRLWLGVPDLRGVNDMVRGDFQSRTIADRAKLYEEWSLHFPDGWFSAVADRVVRLEDRDGNGAADHRTIFADGFNHAMDGIGFSLLAAGDSVYFTCIPKVWKLTDEDDNGIAEKRTAIAEGFGTQVSFIGHDLHGLTWGPDGKLYFSIGDRGYNVTSQEGANFVNPCRGAIFRCYPDGSEFEVFCVGLRNPQELVFDDYGNLFTFDNTGDIGDVARLVYALEGSDSGWHMSHQSAHHYAEILDWGEFRPAKSMWVAEHMFETYREDQPQWVYPPASHVARGPSGATWLTGNAIPKNLRGSFLLANYRGASPQCTVLNIKVKPSGAGFKAVSEEVFVQGIGATDVELGYDGRIYLCDFGGGWTVNKNGSIQVLESNHADARQAGDAVAQLFRRGFDKLEVKSLVTFLGHADRRVRQQAQFELARRNQRTSLSKAANNRQADRLTRLHALWGLGQIAAKSNRDTLNLARFLNDRDPILRANAARILGDLRATNSKQALIKALSDEAPQVRSLAAIALGKVAKPNDGAAIDAIFALAAKNNDVVIRHSCLFALENLQARDESVERFNGNHEERMLAVLALRRLGHPMIHHLLSNSDARVREEAVRAIYDTKLMDTVSGPAVAQYGLIEELPETVQRRVVAANFRLGTPENAGRLLDIAANSSLAPGTREAALQGLRKWTQPPVTDPVLGHHRPLKKQSRDQQTLVAAIGKDLGKYLSQEKTPALLALGLRLAKEIGVNLDPAVLKPQALNANLDASVRVATLDSLVSQQGAKSAMIISTLLKDKNADVRAAAMRHGFGIKLKDIVKLGRQAARKEKFPVTRAAIAGLAKADTDHLLQLWNQRDKQLNQGVWLDAFLALSTSGNEAATKATDTYANVSATNVFLLSEHGGNIKRGKFVFENHGACLQCHKVRDNGGTQGPALDDVGKRLTRAQLLESVYNPNAVITEGFSSITAIMKDESILSGRLMKEDEHAYHLIAPDGKELAVKKADISEKTPPVSAMPPIGAALPPNDLRDIVAYLASLTGGKPAKKTDSH